MAARKSKTRVTASQAEIVPFVATPQMVGELETTANDVQRQLQKAESIDDPLDRIKYIREVLSSYGIAPKSPQEVCVNLLLYWLYARGESVEDLRGEVGRMVKLLKGFQRVLPSDSTRYQGRVNELRERGWTWAEVAAKVTPGFEVSDPFWQRQLISSLRKRNHKWNKTHNIRIQRKSASKKKMKRLRGFTKK